MVGRTVALRTAADFAFARWIEHFRRNGNFQRVQISALFSSTYGAKLFPAGRVYLVWAVSPGNLPRCFLPGGFSASLGVEFDSRAGNKVKIMRYLKYFALLGALLFLSVGSVKAQDYDQGDQGGYYAGYGAYGPPPVCPYGYFSYYPYAWGPFGCWAPRYFA